MADLNSWGTDDFADRPDVLVAMVEVVELVSAASVSKDPQRDDCLQRAFRKVDEVYRLANKPLLTR